MGNFPVSFKFLPIAVALLPLLAACSRPYEARYIPSGSMLPTLQINDRIIIDRTAYQTKLPARGDIVLFTPPPSLLEIAPGVGTETPFIARVIGLPGETLEVKQGKVYINQKLLAEPYLAEAPQYQWGPIEVPAESLIVLGDNRNNSLDSHYWGMLPRQNLLGKAVWRYWSFDRMGAL
jgi:signal peptidase I